MRCAIVRLASTIPLSFSNGSQSAIFILANAAAALRAISSNGDVPRAACTGKRSAAVPARRCERERSTCRHYRYDQTWSSTLLSEQSSAYCSAVSVPAQSLSEQCARSRAAAGPPSCCASRLGVDARGRSSQRVVSIPLPHMARVRDGVIRRLYVTITLGSQIFLLRVTFAWHRFAALASASTSRSSRLAWRLRS